MKIKLISKNQYDILSNIQENNEILNLQNRGYKYIDKSKFTDDEINSFNTVTNILKDHIIGFSEFNNFRLSKTKDIQIRFQYDYGAEDNSMSFIGVGYILLDELLNGFKINK